MRVGPVQARLVAKHPWFDCGLSPPFAQEERRVCMLLHEASFCARRLRQTRCTYCGPSLPGVSVESAVPQRVLDAVRTVRAPVGLDRVAPMLSGFWMP